MSYYIWNYLLRSFYFLKIKVKRQKAKVLATNWVIIFYRSSLRKWISYVVPNGFLPSQEWQVFLSSYNKMFLCLFFSKKHKSPEIDIDTHGNFWVLDDGFPSFRHAFVSSFGVDFHLLNFIVLEVRCNLHSRCLITFETICYAHFIF